MADYCEKCGNRLVELALEGYATTSRCIKCTPVKVTLPGKVKSVHSAVVKGYTDLPLKGEDGDTYYLEKERIVCRYDKSLEDWQIIRLARFDTHDDSENDRRGAIMAQRARKKS